MLKAIETRYKGYRFRSRLEARYAVLFDAIGLQWEYEPEGYVLGDGTHYLPDFYLPEIKAWIEIKGGQATDKELEKCNQLFLSITGKPESTDLLALGEPNFLADFCKEISETIKQQDNTAEASAKKMAGALREAVNLNLSRDYVYCFEGLLRNGWFCLGEFSAQCKPAEVIYTAIGDLLMSDGDITQHKINKASQRKALIEKAFYKARAARFEHGECG